MKQYLRNVSIRRREEDYFVAQTMARAAQWLEENLESQPFLLYVDTFDPHEPWDPPRWYVDLYDPGYEGDEVIYPRYEPCDYLSEAELKHMRALYAGEVTLMDRWVGMLLERIEELGLREQTVVIFTTDHGFYHGEHGLTGKSILTEQFSAFVPLYEEVARIPLMVRFPGQRPGRRQAFAQPPDLMPTILDLGGIGIPDTVQGRSLAPVLREQEEQVRSLALTSPSIIHGTRARRFTTITADEWSVIYPGARVDLREAAESAVVDSITRMEKAAYPGGGGPELYHLPTDPMQQQNVFGRHRDIAEKLHADHVRLLEEWGTPQEHLENRRELTGR